MSLIIKSLKKLKNEEESGANGNIPPSLAKSINNSSKKKKPYLLIFLTVFVAVGAAAYFGADYLLGKNSGDDYSNITKMRAKPKPPVKKTEPIKVAETEKPEPVKKAPVYKPVQSNKLSSTVKKTTVNKTSVTKPAKTPVVAKVKQPSIPKGLKYNPPKSVKPEIIKKNSHSKAKSEKEMAAKETVEKKPSATEVQLQEYLKRINKTETKNNSMLYMAEKALREGNLERAEFLYRKIAVNRMTPSLFNNLVVLSAKRGDIEGVNALASQYPNFMTAQVLASAGADLMDAGKMSDAEKIISYGELKYPESHEIAYVKGSLFERKGDSGKALKYYEKAYNSNNQDIFYAYNYARNLDINEKYDKAYKIYSSLKSITGNNEIKNIAAKRANELAAYLN